MQKLFICAVLVVLASTDARAEDAGGKLTADFDVPVAKISLRSSSRLVQLPRLTFLVSVEAACPSSLEAESVSVSIADTRVSARPDENGIIEKTISVPKKQLAPIAVNDFCTAGQDVNPEEQLVLPDALSAQLSLRCSNDDQESITYKTVSLQVALRCEVPENAQSL